jgi:hypothetical protein
MGKLNSFWHNHYTLRIYIILFSGIILLILSIFIFAYLPHESSKSMAKKFFYDKNGDGVVWPGNGEISVENVIIGDVDGNKAVSIVYVEKDNDFISSMTCSKKYIPKAYQTNKANEVKYIVLIHQWFRGVGLTTIGSAYMMIFDVSIIDKETGGVVAAKSFSGGPPPKNFGGKARNSRAIGSHPNENEVTKWVNEIIGQSIR